MTSISRQQSVLVKAAYIAAVIAIINTTAINSNKVDPLLPKHFIQKPDANWRVTVLVFSSMRTPIEYRVFFARYQPAIIPTTE
jgi:hypothetical protein